MFKYLLIFFPILIFSQYTGKVIAIKDGDTVVVIDSLMNQKKLIIA